MINYILIGRRIEETRRLRRLSQAELAELTGLSVSYISFIENAKRKASLQSLVSIAEVMSTTLDALLGGNQNNGNGEYRNEIIILMEDCTHYEKRIIFEQIHSLKTSLRENHCLLNIQGSTFGLSHNVP